MVYYFVKLDCIAVIVEVVLLFTEFLYILLFTIQELVLILLGKSLIYLWHSVSCSGTHKQKNLLVGVKYSVLIHCNTSISASQRKMVLVAHGGGSTQNVTSWLEPDSSNTG